MALVSIVNAPPAASSLVLAQSAEALRVAIAEMMQALISMDKVEFVSSYKVVSPRLQGEFGPLLGPRRETAVSHGTDVTAGVPRRVRGRAAKAKARLSAAVRRTRRLAMQRP
eukprot:3440595-Pyramimonas_sp.AAC.1